MSSFDQIIYWNQLSDRMRNGRILVIGGGGFFLEVENFLIDLKEKLERTFDDDILFKPGGVFAAEPPVGSILDWPLLQNESEYHFESNDFCVIAIGNNSRRRRVFKKLLGRANLLTLIHPNAYVSRTARIGAGSILAPGVYVGPQSIVAENVVLHNSAQVGHHAVVEAHSVLCPFSAISGNCRVGESSFIGTAASIAPGVSVGSGTTLSAQCFVKTDQPDFAMLTGNPATNARSPTFRKF